MSAPTGNSTVLSLGDLFEFSNGVNADKSAYGSGTPFVNVMEVISNRQIRETDIPGRVTLPEDTASRYEVRFGDVLFNRTSETQDEVGLSATYVGASSVLFGGFVLRGRPISDELDVGYSKYALRAKRVRDQIVARGQGGIRANIGQRDLSSVTVELPSVADQRAVALQLDDVAHSIDLLRLLISKKRAIKLGLMQRLLSGNIRLPGHAGNWTTRSIGSLTQVKTGGTPSTRISRFWGGGVRWMSSGEVHLKRVSEVRGRITEAGFDESAAQLLPVGTVLMALAGQGKTRGTVAVSRIELSTNQSIAGILPSDDHDSDFLYYNLDMRYDELRGGSAGDGGRGALNLSIIKKVDVQLPPLDEQRAIATVLSDADDELAALELRLRITLDIEEGMIQKLVRGSTEGDVA